MTDDGRPSVALKTSYIVQPFEIHRKRLRPARQEPAAYPMACHYVRTELDRHAHCARRAGAMIRLAPAHAARLPFHHGLAEVAIPVT